MDNRLIVDPTARPDAGQADVPLVSMGWRALREVHKRHASDRRQLETELDRMKELMSSQADSIHQLRTLVAEHFRDGTGSRFAAIADRLEKALAAAGVVILAPVGDRFDGELVELFENVAQRVSADCASSRIDEIILPAIVFRGTLLRQGKAIIAVPGPATNTTVTETNLD